MTDPHPNSNEPRPMRPRSGPSSLRRQFSWTLPATIIYGFSNFALLMILNKWAISDDAGIEAAGRFNWAMAVTAPLFMFANLRFRTIFATDVNSRFRIADFFWLRSFLLGLAILVVSLMGIWLAVQGNPEKGTLVLVIALGKVIEAISDLCCGLQQRVSRMDRIAASMTAHGLGMVFAFTAVYLTTSNLTYAALGLVASRLLILCCYDIPVGKLASVEITQPKTSRPTDSSRDAKRIWNLLILASPLGVTAGLISLTSNIPKYVISDVFDEGMLGIYASLAMTIQAGNLIFRAVEMPVMPRLAGYIARGESGPFWRLLLIVAGMFAGLATLGASFSLFFGGYVLSFLFNPAYASLGWLLAMVVVCTAIAQITGIVELAMIPARLTVVQLPLHCLTVGLCFLLSLVLIPRFEVCGALLAVTVCRFPFLLVGVWLLSRKMRKASTCSAHTIVADSATDGIRDAA